MNERVRGDVTCGNNLSGQRRVYDAMRERLDAHPPTCAIGAMLLAESSIVDGDEIVVCQHIFD